MKLDFFVLLSFLGVCGPTLAVSSIDECKVASYRVTRESNNAADTFTIKMKDGQICDSTGNWCTSLSAYHNPRLSWNGTSCSCTCDYSKRSFLLPLQTCVHATSADTFGGCPPALQTPVNLQTNGKKTTCIKSGQYKSCTLLVEFFDYNGFHPSWENISDIFSLNKTNQIYFLVWEADIARKLSGRIIRLNFSCSKATKQASIMSCCMVIKALGTVTYLSGSSSLTQCSYPAVPTSSPSIAHSSPLLPPPIPSPPTTPSDPTSSPSSSLVFAISTRKLRSASTGILTISTSVPSQSRSLHRRPAFTTSRPDLSQSMTEHRSSLPVYSEGAFSHLVSTAILNTIISTSYSIEPSKSSLAAEASSRSDVIDGPGNKKARTSGSDNGTVIGAAVGGAVVFGIFIIVIIVFFKRRKLGNGKDKPTKLRVQVKNPTYGSSDIPLSSATEKPATTSMEQDSQPTYQDLITDTGKLVGGAIYNNPDNDDYDNYNSYQSLDKKVPGSPVYQSLAKAPLDTGKPTPKSKPSITGPPGERRDDTAEPVYNVIEQPDTEQGTMPEKASGDSDGHTQSEPVYNVLDVSDSEENYDADDSLYNVLEGPESIEDQQQPLYNVLESSDAEKSSLQGAEGSCGLSNEPLYNVVEGPDSDGPNKDGVGYDGPNGSSSSDGHDNPAYEESLNLGPAESGVGYAAPNGSSSPDAHDNPAYEQSLDFDVPYASVQKPGSQRESVYEPLQGPNDHSLYEPLK